MAWAMSCGMPIRRTDSGAPLGNVGRIVKRLAHRRDHHAGADDIAPDAVRAPSTTAFLFLSNPGFPLLIGGGIFLAYLRSASRQV
jgi:hypothetical protein